MAVVKPFRGLRPPPALVRDLACLPYDVMNTDEAARMAKGQGVFPASYYTIRN